MVGKPRDVSADAKEAIAAAARAQRRLEQAAVAYVEARQDRDETFRIARLRGATVRGLAEIAGVSPAAVQKATR